MIAYKRERPQVKRWNYVYKNKCIVYTHIFDWRNHVDVYLCIQTCKYMYTCKYICLHTSLCICINKVTFWDRKCLHHRGAWNTNLLIQIEISNHFNFQGQSISDFIFWNTASGDINIFICKVNIWKLNSTAATAPNFISRVRHFYKNICSWIEIEHCYIKYCSIYWWLSEQTIPSCLLLFFFVGNPSFYGVILHHTRKHKLAHCRITIPSPTQNPTNAMTT